MTRRSNVVTGQRIHNDDSSKTMIPNSSIRKRTMDRLIELGELSGQDPIQIVMDGLAEWVNANYHKLKQHYSD